MGIPIANFVHSLLFSIGTKTRLHHFTVNVYSAIIVNSVEGTITEKGLDMDDNKIES